MSRIQEIRSSYFPFHITVRVNDRKPFPAPLEEVWKILSLNCLIVVTVYGIKFHAIVLMPNHIHFVLSSPEGQLSEAKRYMISETSREVNSIARRTGHLFGSRAHGSLIGTSQYFAHAMKYVYRNPVKAGLCARVEDFRFSTLSGLLGTAPMLVPISHSVFRFPGSRIRDEMTENLEWFNRSYTAEQMELIRKALRRSEFKLEPRRVELKDVELD